MSKLEQQVKPLLLELIEGKNTVIPEDMVEPLYLWAVKTDFMFQQTDKSSLSVTNQQLAECRNQYLPITGTRVLLARNAGGQIFRAVHSKIGWVNSSDFREQRGRGGVTVFLFGAIAFVVVSASSQAFFEEILRMYPQDLTGKQELFYLREPIAVTSEIDKDFADRVTLPPKR